LLSFHLKAFTGSTLIETSRLMSGHQNKMKVAGTPGHHRGLTAHEEPAPLAEVIGDDE
jgi:hypothetical protein